jgi:hypothetical protein
VNDGFVKPELKSILSRAVVNRTTAHDNSEHDLKKWKPVFGQDHAQSKNQKSLISTQLNRPLGVMG